MNIRISDRAAAIGESQTLAISARAKQMQKEGIDVIGFGAGEPDFPTPAHIVDAAEKAMRDGATRYTPASGTPELKEAAAAWLERESGVKYSPSQVIVSCGAKHSLYNLMQVLFQAGDQVFLPAPYWVTYPEQIRLAGAEPVVLDTGADAGFRITADQLKEKITPSSKGLVLNSPCNPTGALYSRKELEEIAGVCVENEIVVISDEIYSRLVYDSSSHVSIASLGDDIRDLTFMVNGVSKTYAMTGWRIGFAAGPEEAMKAIGRLQSQSTSNPTSVAQAASLAALNGDQDIVEEMRQEFDARRQLMVERLEEIPGVTCAEPQGAFYCFPSVKGLLGRSIGGVDISGSADLARECLAKANVAVVPGEPFGADEFVRLSYATSREKIEEGIRRLRDFVSCE
jgi:aspartate aminotransferase